MNDMAKRITFSLFGEIECIVAQQMMSEGKDIVRLPQWAMSSVPHDVRWSKMGYEVRMVVTIDRRELKEFEQRIEEMRL